MTSQPQAATATESTTKPVGDIYNAMVRVMSLVEPIAKTRQADKFKFRGVDDLYQALQRIMADCGVFSLPFVEEIERKTGTYKSGSTFEHVILTIRYRFFARDGSYVDARVIGEGMDSGDKASNKAMSVADKYALLQAFKIPTAEPKDPENDSHDIAPPAKTITLTPSATRKDPIASSQANFADQALTPNQMKLIWALWRELKRSDDEMREALVRVFKKDTTRALTQKEASLLIDDLRRQKDTPQPPGAA